MKLYFDEVFRSLRKGRNLTQQQAAELFGVSPQAVSRWETGEACPDISLLPAMADYFRVSIEQLLGADEGRRKERLEEILAEYQKAIFAGKIEDCIRIARAGLKEFPNSYELMDKLMYALFAAGDDAVPNGKENDTKNRDEIISLAERILDGCTDDKIRLYAKSRLGFFYCETGDKEKGRAIIDSLPDEDTSRERYLYWALDGEERLDYMRGRIFTYTKDLVQELWRCSRHTEDDGGKLACLELCEKIVEMVFSEGDYGQWFNRLAGYYICDIAPIYLGRGENERALALLEKALCYMRRFESLPDPIVHTSLPVKGVRDDKRNETSDQRPLGQRMAERLDMPCYDGLRCEPRVETVRQGLLEMK